MLDASSPTERRKAIDAGSYDATAGAFDALTERFAAPLAERMLDLASLKPTDSLLDVGVGTGLVALRAAARLERGEVVGIDHSEGMLSQAIAKAVEQGVADRTAFLTCDAEALVFENDAFDAVASLFVLMHLPNPLAATREMFRVLKPGGRVVIAVGSGPQLASMQGLAAAARAAPTWLSQRCGQLLLAPQYLRGLMIEHGLWSHQADDPHSHRVSVRDLLRTSGFASVSTSWLGAAVELEPEDFWSVQAIYSSGPRIRLSSLEPERVSALKADFMERTGRVRTRGGRLVYQYGALFHVAVKPK
ncbi:MAG: methyltransferase domain-containing protein [Phenylobacterium sp.]|uniref:class I SAM-dependent methyltransferase n=1 Tax=Phenylobacterium sp. TaxID=1871053 RepID=UPI002735B6DB|nr:methyltransferase domain-containing protein [Phenylobacterium sp.]MDP3174712.1 methyltransferase domain-containing protein [Phenylobacterium sp.]